MLKSIVEKIGISGKVNESTLSWDKMKKYMSDAPKSVEKGLKILDGEDYQVAVDFRLNAPGSAHNEATVTIEIYGYSEDSDEFDDISNKFKHAGFEYYGYNSDSIIFAIEYYTDF